MSVKEKYYDYISNLVKNKAEIQYSLVSKHLDFTGKHILEIGCGKGVLARYMAKTSGAKFINAIEYDLDMFGIQPYSIQNLDISQGDARTLKFADNTFDYVISVGVFEHIIGLDKALHEIERVLKPGGKCYAFFEPIWCCVNGHHFNNAVSKDSQLIPPWGHLYMNEDEMYRYIYDIRDESTAKDVVEWIYKSSFVNRYTRKNYFDYFLSTRMTIVYLCEMCRANRVQDSENEFFLLTHKQQEQLLNKYNKEDLLVGGFEVILQKNVWYEQHEQVANTSESVGYIDTKNSFELQAKINQLENKLDSLLNSTSWKLTRPIRYLGRILKKRQK